MIRVKVFPPAFCNFDKLDERGWLDLPDGAKLSDVLRDIRMPKALAKCFQVSVNSVRAKPDTVLEDGDVVGFFWLLTGG